MVAIRPSTWIGYSGRILITFIHLFLFFPVRTSSFVSAFFTHTFHGTDRHIGYYNEARILDPLAFNTLTTLPNIPGAVNDCKKLESMRQLLLIDNIFQSMQGVHILLQVVRCSSHNTHPTRISLQFYCVVVRLQVPVSPLTIVSRHSRKLRTLHGP